MSDDRWSDFADDIACDIERSKKMSARSALQEARPIWAIAREIRAKWVKKDGTPNVWFGAVPYLKAMETLTHINEMYGLDTAQTVVIYFLANAAQFKGEDARRIKKEIRQIAGLK